MLKNENTFEYRRLSACETGTALSLIWRVFSEYESPDYAPEGTEEFRATLRNEAYLTGIEYYGAFDGTRLIGTVGIRKNACHICFFFVDGAYHRRGVGTGLFRALRADYRGRILTLNSSPYGKPFYRSLGFTEIGPEQTVNGIRFTPMRHKDPDADLKIVNPARVPGLDVRAAGWFSSKWSVPEQTYLDSIRGSVPGPVPAWYVCMNGERIVGGLGVIENDFHDRKDLTPNVCAVYTEPYYRGLGIAGKLLNSACADMRARGIGTLYLLTDLTGFYERYGWEYLCPVTGEGETRPSRMYVRRQQ